MSTSGQHITAALIQMNSQHDCRENMRQAQTLMSDAVSQGCDLLVLPENFLCFGHSGLSRLSAFLDALLNDLKAFAKAHAVTIVAGSIAHQSEQDAARYFSRSLVIGPQGQVQASYDKCHLFDVDVADGHGRYRESDTYLSGREAVVTEVHGARLGLSICYDLRFGNLYQALVERGAQLITVPSAFTAVTGRAHWEVLLRARAIETQCYLLAANQCGDHGKGRETWGHSMIVDPWGKILAECDDTPGFCHAELDLQYLAEIRKAIPMQSHKRRF